MLGLSKDVYIKALDELKKSGAKAVGFDILFQNPDPNEVTLAQKLKEFGNAAIAVVEPQKLNSSIGDLTLSNCDDTQKNGNIENFICPFTPRYAFSGVTWGIILSENSRNDSITKQVAWYNLADTPMQYEMKYGKNAEKKISSPVYNLGFTLALNDGIPLAKKMAEQFKKSAKSVVKIPQPYFVDNYKNNSPLKKPYPNISLEKLVNPNNAWAFTSILSGAYVLVGESGQLLHDTFISPVTAEPLPWVYSHAMFLDGILQNKMLSEMPTWQFYTILSLTIILAVVVFFFLPKYISPVVAIVLMILLIFLSRYSYANLRIIFDIFPLLLASGILTYPATYIYKFFILDRDKRQILQAFSRYLSPSVVAMIDTKQLEASLGGEKKELSILFSDIAGFTTISEKMDTKDLFILMTSYLSTMTNILIEEKWTLDKYIGDAVMGFFGAPVADPFHAKNACNTALRMRHALHDFNTELEKKNIEKIDFRVGIASGEVMVGNIGSERQFNYTVLGDTVNLASRLEATGKEYGVNVIIAADTRAEVGDEFLVRELDTIAVKGKNEWVRIFELLGKKWDSIDMTKYLSYESALRLYREGKYLEAGQIFEKYITTDPASEIMAKRCLAVLKGEIEIENGIYRMTHK